MTHFKHQPTDFSMLNGNLYRFDIVYQYVLKKKWMRLNSPIH